jgi:hypothetical protein
MNTPQLTVMSAELQQPPPPDRAQPAEADRQREHHDEERERPEDPVGQDLGRAGRLDEWPEEREQAPDDVADQAGDHADSMLGHASQT